MQATRFPARASGPAERAADFISHLRMNGLNVGPQETQDALTALTFVEATDRDAARLALKALLVPGHDVWRRFDDLYESFWFNRGRQRGDQVKTDHVQTQHSKPTLWQRHIDPEADPGAADGGEGQADNSAREAEGIDGRLIATRTQNLTRRDLRELMDEESLQAAERAAERLAKALRDRRSRRYRAALRGRRLDMRRTLRASLAHGGEPIELFRKHRPDRPLQIVALCDVSGSMTVYARVFLAFLKGLVSADARTDAYLFHTRLIRVTPALRDRDTLRAAGRLSLMAEGFAGGTDIAGAITRFNASYSARAVNGRTVVLILSDGYCTSPGEALGRGLAKLRRRAHRIVWLNPLKAWRDYAPVARGMAAALPHLDAHLPANTIDALAALEPEFEKI
ncbi:MAG: VWA domain-containing protein [Pseudomonadota bacterium]